MYIQWTKCITMVNKQYNKSQCVPPWWAFAELTFPIFIYFSTEFTKFSFSKLSKTLLFDTSKVKNRASGYLFIIRAEGGGV